MNTFHTTHLAMGRGNATGTFKLSLLVAASAGVLLLGCARFEHQTAESEPHCLVRIARASDSGGAHGAVDKFDGRSVREGKEYRVTPGVHVVIIQYTDTGLETFKPMSIGIGTSGSRPSEAAEARVSQSGRVSVSGVNPNSAMQPVNLRIEDRRLRYATNSIKFEAEWGYELDGDNVTKTRALQPR